MIAGRGRGAREGPRARRQAASREARSFELARNAGLDGRCVADELAARGCTDVIVRGLGPGAWAHVKAAGMRVWVAGADEPERALIGKLEAGGLRRLAPEDAGRHVHRAGR